MGLALLPCSVSNNENVRGHKKAQERRQGLSLGWVNLASWNDLEEMIGDEPKHVSNISFMLMNEGLRMVVTAYPHIPLFLDTIENIDADNPGSAVAIVLSQSNVLWKRPVEEEVVTLASPSGTRNRP
ncbi:hypothetical protein Asppvi_007085 [Aspergillus pseudoviridinutans]|uniref:Uncharacterized protein n=1 Tax=Aspergillus pseudoviridinutans TaxID=1517512 RepID=A0A9P3BFI5_9EURO|nr:uncharacterized protein Asppvi_007085 [Aspergillus pseudoviridinutans]GIJ88168.1 hypothetical protein Asppvi_007085 [Aspergillus pseudoviridinutans]